MGKTERVVIIQTRRNILRNLDLVYPTGLTVRFLYRTVCAVNEMYDMSLLAKDIAYLKEKGYVKYIDDVMGGMDKFEDKTVKLTARGLEIAQDVIDDEALEV